MDEWLKEESPEKNSPHSSLTDCPSLQILDEWFGRTIIRSCTKLSYEHAQSMIESPTEKIPATELPPISPEHSSEEVHQAVLNLHGIAKRLRQQRFEDGALRLDQFCFSLYISSNVMLVAPFAEASFAHHFRRSYTRTVVGSTAFQMGLPAPNYIRSKMKKVLPPPYSSTFNPVTFLVHLLKLKIETPDPAAE
ncbi:hypothetical protein P7K49_013470 [Saguinus oedipus]|uniref:RNB domain-containing protein n=1 Tax=Saguinus oedipus TaxID=9490 RepID=A0ABQ9VG05_SAGOE|nr:hypothetical protein P7K49_013470 [Saguinus oedipus]